MKQKLTRMTNILKATEETCKQIMIQLSGEKYDPKMLEIVAQQYSDYVMPIKRTVDIISNNSAFLAQLYTAFNNQLLPKPQEQ